MVKLKLKKKFSLISPIITLLVVILLFKEFTSEGAIPPLVAVILGAVLLFSIIDFVRRFKHGGVRSRSTVLTGFWPQLLAGLGLIPFAVGVAFIFIDLQIQLDRNGVEELSTVESVKRDTGGRNSRGYDAYVRTNYDKERIRLDIENSVGRTLEVGDSLLIRHVPGKPRYAVLAQSETEEATAGAIVMAFVLLCLAAYLIHSAYKEKSK